jgi:hypothetical protein
MGIVKAIHKGLFVQAVYPCAEPQVHLSARLPVAAAGGQCHGNCHHAYTPYEVPHNKMQKYKKNSN